MSDNNANTSFYWYDFETWGIDPKSDPPCQFAGIRTDQNFNIIGDPLNIYNRIPSDYLPNLQACLITGITPQLTLQKGLIEPEFVKKIHDEMSVPNTCVLGYNSIRFDDEVMRFSLYRNFYDPYAREWQNNNSRWDLIDVVRAVYAVRPEGINWPQKEDGSVSFRLEELTQANQLTHEKAHDAMSDVYGTIALAKLVKQAQPKLFDYLFTHRKKQTLKKQINLYDFKPLLHISSKLPAINGCSTWVLPIAIHPKNPNALITIDLGKDIAPLLNLSSEALHQQLYMSSEELEASNEQRPPIKLVHLNKCPVLLPAGAMSEQRAIELNLNKTQCIQNLNLIKRNAQLADKLISIFNIGTEFPKLDPEQALYSGSFFSHKDRSLMEQILHNSENSISYKEWDFEDERLDPLLFRYRARNFPHTLLHEEQVKWQRHRHAKIVDSGRLKTFQDELMYLAEQYRNNTDKTALLNALFEYAQNL